MKTQDQQDDWKKEAPKLASLPKKQEFDVPEGYFDSLSGKIMARIAAEETPDKSRFRRKFLLFTLIPASAAAAVLILVTLLKTPDTGGQILANGEPDFSKLSDEELFQALEDEGISEHELIAAVGPENLQIPVSEQKIEQQLDKVPEAEIQEYLEEMPLEDLDLEEIDLEGLI